MQLQDIKVLHVELSSRCNAWCPGCPRNNQGYGLREGLVPQDLDFAKLQDAVLKLPNLERVQLCGRFGDPVLHQSFTDVVKWLIERQVIIHIHTNGSLRTAKWWSELGAMLKGTNHNVWFGIDGLKGVHEIYRQATDFDHVISSAQAFISAGGIATWQFLPFKHNEHQIKDCLKLAVSMGFDNFEIIEGVRNPYTAYNYRTQESYEIGLWSKTEQFNYRHNEVKFLAKENCVHLMAPELYMSSSGKYTMCCHFDSIYKEHEPIMFDTIEETVPVDIATELNTQPRPLCVTACAGISIQRKVMPLAKLKGSK